MGGPSPSTPQAKVCSSSVGGAVPPLDLLAATLTNVLAQWEAGQLPHFTAPELRALVAALFPDSAQRRAGLGKLDAG